MEYNFPTIEKAARKIWKEIEVYKVSNNTEQPKCYVLDMFPYPSGSGLHVGHPLGYIASDIFARYKKMKGFNVLHPMGFDAFGLPAEQYALETGQHPAVTTEENIARYKKQLDNIGFCYDWNRELRTSDPKYYKWTQWIFLQLFKSWFNRKTQKAEPLSNLIRIFEQEGNAAHPAPGAETLRFTAAEWNEKQEAEKRAALMSYRLAYLDHAEVWWCEALGTVLANDEVVNGLSERGGHPVEKKNMRQWFLRITEFADRLLNSLDGLDWSEAMKEMQRNWIGKSEGAEIEFNYTSSNTGTTPSETAEANIKVFTTRPDTIFGVDFIVLAPEHPLVSTITTATQQAEVSNYVAYVKSRSERERMAEKKISGCFTGAYALHPFHDKKIPIWISEYVLAGYGTGAIMAVPSGDDRDHAFARHFNIPITNIFGDSYTGAEAISDKHVTIENSDFLSGLAVKEATAKALDLLEKEGIGKRKINYKLRDAGFSRQRYWGEPFPIAYKNDIPYALDEAALNLPEALQQLPLELPHVAHYQPGPEGEGPLANIHDWVFIKNKDEEILKRETNTMPGYAGSSWYFLRYMDPDNDREFADTKATDYWNQVDLYIGGTEHAVGHLLYSRMWTKTLCDLGFLSFDEPFKRLLNQGMIQGSSRFVYGAGYDFEILSLDPHETMREIANNKPLFIISQYFHDTIRLDETKHSLASAIVSSLENKYKSRGFKVTRITTFPIQVDFNIVNGVELDLDAFNKAKNSE
jgi:leucyl-tRNA synthetase